MKKITAYIAFVALIAFLFFLYGFSSNRNGTKKVKNTVVEFEEGDNNFLTHNMVDKMLIQNKEFVKNQPKSVVDLHFLETNVSANPYVEKATVFLTINGVLKTLIKQRKPVARLVDNDSIFYVDKYGVKIPLSANFSARVPLVSGVGNAEEIKELIQLLQTISSDDFFKKEIIAIKRNAQNEYVFTVRTGDYKIVFGKFELAYLKFKKLKAFYNKALIDGSIKQYKTINVKYHNQVVCTKHNQDGKQ
ncbi:cell division protein FtsQ [Tenacibaculum sp. MAR_2009_124]|uniref:cell division protein FtsQ/DivIB n=1 Tax=Tenacibaculum sp. MAR_2009_124 TaxID=1250059 RepID=UPI00089A26B4|nr:cell division protein FtsQ [Tenacibaculum sp. MAR_2009_124]SEB66645.1 cell division protein FtsQ [Tenacibaculum sp. MAR_2009_124]